MNRYITIVLLAFGFVVTSIQLYAQSTSLTKTGTTAASFLKIGVGARPIATGGAFTGVANDISSMYWNSAGLSRLQQTEVAFNHVNWIADIKYDVAALALVIDGVGTLGGSFSALTIGDMDVTTTDMPEGTGERFSSGASMMSLSYGRALTDQFSIGFNVKYLREYIWNESASDFAFDFGTLYTAHILNGVTIGASMSNFGSKMKLEGRDVLKLLQTGAGGQNLINTDLELQSFELPLVFRVGLSTDVMNVDDNRLTVAVDAVHPNDNTESINSGMEYSWGEIVFLRGGWKSAFERGTEEGLTLGAGFQYTVTTQLVFIIDYAYMDFGRLKEVNYLSIGLKF